MIQEGGGLFSRLRRQADWQPANGVLGPLIKAARALVEKISGVQLAAVLVCPALEHQQLHRLPILLRLYTPGMREHQH